MTGPAVHSPAHSENRSLVDFARREMGSKVKIENASRDIGRLTIIWRLTGSDGSRTWLKHHERTELYQRELTGLEVFVPKLGRQTWWCAPAVIAKDDQIEAILMSEVEGAILESASVSVEEIETMFSLAGKFSRMLHDLDYSTTDGNDAQTYSPDRLFAYLNEARQSVDEDILNWAQKRVEKYFSETSIRRVPCHMDYSPRNWIIQRSHEGIRFGVIDWERARPELWLHDIQRLAYDDWHREPGLRDRYFLGFGRQLTKTEEQQLDVLCVVMSIASINWAQSKGDNEFVAHSRTVIERVLMKHGVAC